MSGEAEIVGVVARVAIAVFGPMIEEALRGGKSEEEIVAELRGLSRPALRDTTAEDAARRARLHASAVSHDDIANARAIANSPSTGARATASILRIAAVAEAVKLDARSEDSTRPTKLGEPGGGA